jgi:hypothetical protein
MKTLIVSLIAATSLMSFDLPNVSIVSILPDQTEIGNRTSITTLQDTDALMPIASSIDGLPAFSWTETAFDFGKIKHNAPVTHEFRFTNNGAEPLIITSVQASCGCTVAKYSKDPIVPGGEGFVTATYNAATKGIFNKSVTVNANTQEGVVVLAIRGEVE